MRQIVQNYKTGEIKLVEVPGPAMHGNSIVVRTVNSLVSVGTEKAMIDVANKAFQVIRYSN